MTAPVPACSYFSARGAAAAQQQKEGGLGTAAGERMTVRFGA